jgi:DNA-binding CsgD family transcriptional regulator
MPMLRVLISEADSSPEAISVSPRAVRAVTQITTGLTALLRALDEAEQRVRAYENPEARLTSREWQVLHLLTEGRTNTEIGSQLYISMHTVRGHTRNILRKLGVSSRQEAADWALRIGPIPGRTMPKTAPPSQRNRAPPEGTQRRNRSDVAYLGGERLRRTAFAADGKSVPVS